jgi:hypothetical protein
MLYILLFSSVFWNDSTLRYNKALKLTLSKSFLKISDDFYTKTTSTASKERIVIFDNGNAELNIYNSSGKKLAVYGKKGNGPEELLFSTKYDTPYIFSNKIYFLQPYKLTILDKNGLFLSEHKIPYAKGAALYENDSRVLIRYKNGKTFDVSLNKIRTEEFAMREERGRSFDHFFQSSKQIVKVPQGFVHVFPGEYKLRFEPKGAPTVKISREFMRLKDEREDLDRQLAIAEKKLGSSFRIAAMLITARHKVSKGYADDIDSHLGNFKQYVLFETASDNGMLSIDIIDFEKREYGTFELKDKDYISSRVEYGKLILNCKNDNEGPYVKIYNISGISRN